MVADGRVRWEDKEGTDAADIATDFGRLRQTEVVIDAQRNLLRVKKELYLGTWLPSPGNPRESLNLDGSGGSSVHPTAWDCGSRPKIRRIDSRLIEDLAVLPGPPGFLDSAWVLADSGPITDPIVEVSASTRVHQARFGIRLAIVSRLHTSSHSLMPSCATMKMSVSTQPAIVPGLFTSSVLVISTTRR